MSCSFTLSGSEAAIELDKIDSLPKGEYYCQPVTVTGNVPKGGQNAQAKPGSASFKYCNINYR